MSFRIRHLKVALGVIGVLALVGAIVGLIFAGGPGAVGVLAGVALVALSYTTSTLAIAWADSVNPQLVFPVGMAMYVTKFSLFGVLLIAVGATTWPGKIPVAIGIVAGVVAWTGAQIWWAVHHEHPFVGPPNPIGDPPPAPPPRS